MLIIKKKFPLYQLTNQSNMREARDLLHSTSLYVERNVCLHETRARYALTGICSDVNVSGSSQMIYLSSWMQQVGHGRPAVLGENVFSLYSKRIE